MLKLAFKSKTHLNKKSCAYYIKHPCSVLRKRIAYKNITIQSYSMFKHSTSAALLETDVVAADASRFSLEMIEAINAVTTPVAEFERRSELKRRATLSNTAV